MTMLARRRAQPRRAVVVPWTRWLPVLALVLSQHALASAQRLPPPQAALQRHAAADEAPLRPGPPRGTDPDGGGQAQSAVRPAPAPTPLPLLLGDDAWAPDTARAVSGAPVSAAALDGGVSAAAPPSPTPPLGQAPSFPWKEGADVTPWAPWKPPAGSGWPSSSCHCRDNIFALTAHTVGGFCLATPTVKIVQKTWDPLPTWPPWSIRPVLWPLNGPAPSPSPSPGPSAAAVPLTGLRGFSLRSRAFNSSCCPETRFEYACAAVNVSSSVQVTLWTDPFKLGTLLDMPANDVSCMAGTIVHDGLPDGQAATTKYRVPRTGFLQSFVLQASENRQGSDRARYLYNCTFPASDSGVTADDCIEYLSAGTDISSDRAGDVSILSGSDSVPGTEAVQVVCPADRLLSSFRLERYKRKGGASPRVRYRYVCCRGRQDRSRWRVRPLTTGDNVTELARIYDVAESALVVSNLRLLANWLLYGRPAPDDTLKVDLGSTDGVFRASSALPANRTTIRIPWSMSQKDAIAQGDMAVAILRASKTVSLAPGTSMSDFVKLIVATLAPIDIVVADAMHRLAASFIPEASASVISKATGEVVHRIAAGPPVQTEGTKQMQAAYLLSAVTSALVNVTALATLDVLAAVNATFAKRLDEAHGAVARQLCETLGTRAAKNASRVLNTTLAGNASMITTVQEDALCSTLIGRRPSPRRHVLAAIGTAMLPFVMLGCDGSFDCRLGWQNVDGGAKATRSSPQIRAAADLEAFGRFAPVDPGVIVADGYWNSSTPASLVEFDPRDYDIYFALKEQPDRLHPGRARGFWFLFPLIVLIVTTIVLVTVAIVYVVVHRRGLVVTEETHSDGTTEITSVDLESLSLFRLQAPVMQHLELAGALPLFPRYRPWTQDQNFYNPWTDPPSRDFRPGPPLPGEYGYRNERVLPREWSDGSGGQSGGGGFVDPSTGNPFALEPLTFWPLPPGIVAYNENLMMMIIQNILTPAAYRPGSPNQDDSEQREKGPNSKKCRQILEDGDKSLELSEGDGLLAGYAGLGNPNADDPGKCFKTHAQRKKRGCPWLSRFFAHSSAFPPPPPTHTHTQIPPSHPSRDAHSANSNSILIFSCQEGREFLQKRRHEKPRRMASQRRRTI